MHIDLRIVRELTLSLLLLPTSTPSSSLASEFRRGKNIVEKELQLNVQNMRGKNTPQNTTNKRRYWYRTNTEGKPFQKHLSSVHHLDPFRNRRLAESGFSLVSLRGRLPSSVKDLSFFFASLSFLERESTLPFRSMVAVLVVSSSSLTLLAS